MTSMIKIPPAPARQQGVVLILALFIVALVTTVVVSVSWRFNLSMALHENRWHGAQARAYLEGAEQLAALVLVESLQEGEHDWLGQMWAQQGQPLPTDEGWVMGEIEDAQGRLNLNALKPLPPATGTGSDGRQQRAQRSADPTEQFSGPQRQFVRLLQLLELEDGQVDMSLAIEITQAVQDWLSTGDTPSGFGGAGQDYYASLDPPYPMTRGPMTTVSELSIIRGVTPEMYQQLLPYVIVLPEDVTMNINTMPDLLLRTLNRKDDLMPLSQQEFEMLLEERNAALEGFSDVSMFTNSQIVQSILGGTEEFDGANLGVSSSFFLLFGETMVGEQVRRSKSLLVRDRAQRRVDVVRRTDANF